MPNRYTVGIHTEENGYTEVHDVIFSCSVSIGDTLELKDDEHGEIEVFEIVHKQGGTSCLHVKSV